jgi:hypothetical protein
MDVLAQRVWRLAMADKIMVVRHGEKPGDPPPPYGVDDKGEQDKDSLNVLGWQRSGALACLFSSWGAAARPGLAVPATIFATEPKSKSKRPEETVSALAALLNIATNLGFKDGHEADLAAAAVAADGPVLIAWHHQGIPAIADAILGNSTTTPQHWPGKRFDMVWVFDLIGGAWAFSQVPQMVLAGDSATPIPMNTSLADEQAD